MIPENEWVVDKVVEYFDKLDGTTANVMVVGGAVRDLLLDRPVKDIDFAISTGRIPKVRGEVEKKLRDTGFTRVSNPAYTGGSDFVVFSAEGGLVQAIVNNHITGLDFIASQFDIGLCMVALTAQGKIFKSDAFTFDEKFQTLTLLVRDGPMSLYQWGNALVDHLPRIKEKYQTYMPRVEYPRPHETITWESGNDKWS